MDERLPAGSGADGPAGGQRPRGAPGGRPIDSALERRLAALETRLDDLDEAIREVLPNAVRHAVESACREAVAEEMQQVTENLRRSVSELGRLLLRDLDRLTKLLAEHRDTIVERLLEPLPPEAVSTETPSGVFDDLEELDEGAEERAEEADEELAAPPGAPPALVGEEGRWRVLPGGRRPRRGRRRSRGRTGRERAGES